MKKENEKEEEEKYKKKKKSYFTIFYFIGLEICFIFENEENEDRKKKFRKPNGYFHDLPREAHVWFPDPNLRFLSYLSIFNSSARIE